jgi:hypothetical protein
MVDEVCDARALAVAVAALAQRRVIDLRCKLAVIPIRCRPEQVFGGGGAAASIKRLLFHLKGRSPSRLSS